MEEENEYQLDRENDYLTPIHQPTFQNNVADPFVADMARAQLEMGAAQIDSTNPNFGSRYASLPSVAKVAKIINKYGFMITHDVHQEPNHLMVETIVSHISGRERSTQISIPLAEYTTRDGKVKKVDAHMIGSAITYGRRYGLAAILGIPADEDDDGNLAAIGLTPAQSGPAQTQRPAQDIAVGDSDIPF